MLPLPSATLFRMSLDVSIGCALLALLLAILFHIFIAMKSEGTERMESELRECSALVWIVMRAFLGICLLHAALFSLLLYIFFDTGWTGVQTGAWGQPVFASTYALGMCAGVVVVWVSLRGAILAAGRAAQAARTSLRQSLRISSLGAFVSGFTVMGTAVIGVAGVFLILTSMGIGIRDTLHILIACTLGTGTVACIARLCGGQITISAHAAEPILAMRSPHTSETHHVALSADVGALFASVGGRSVEALTLMMSGLVGAMMIGVDTSIGPPGNDIAILLPLFIACIGIFGTAISTLTVRLKSGDDSVTPTLRLPTLTAVFVACIGTYGLGAALLTPRETFAFTMCAAAGLLPILFHTLFGASYDAPRSKEERARVLHSGCAFPFLMSGMWALRDVFFLVLLSIFSSLLAGFFLGAYGIATAVVSALALSGTTVTSALMCSIAARVRSIVAKAELPRQVLARATSLMRSGRIMESDAAAAGAVVLSLFGILFLLLHGKHAIPGFFAQSALPASLFASLLGVLLSLAPLMLSMQGFLIRPINFVADVRRSLQDATIRDGFAPVDHVRGFRSLTASSGKSTLLLVSAWYLVVVLLELFPGVELLGLALLVASTLSIILLFFALSVRGGFQQCIETSEEGGSSAPRECARFMASCAAFLEHIVIPVLELLFPLALLLAILASTLGVRGA